MVIFIVVIEKLDIFTLLQHRENAIVILTFSVYNPWVLLPNYGFITKSPRGELLNFCCVWISTSLAVSLIHAFVAAQVHDKTKRSILSPFMNTWCGPIHRSFNYSRSLWKSPLTKSQGAWNWSLNSKYFPNTVCLSSKVDVKWSWKIAARIESTSCKKFATLSRENATRLKPNAVEWSIKI